jgi:hypothetical protein
MDFYRATSLLTQGVTLGELAQQLGVTAVDVSRARTDRSSRYHRAPPEGWEAAVARLARREAAHLQKLAQRVVRAGEGGQSGGRASRRKRSSRRRR